MVALVVALSGASSALRGQVTRVGGEFQVNSYTNSNQSRPSVATDANGGSVVAWLTGTTVAAQRFSASGVPLAAEFQVNTSTIGGAVEAVVAASAAGDFVVAWGTGIDDGSGTSVRARRWTSAGVAQAAEFRVNSYTLDDQRFPSVAVGPAGDFLIAWQSSGQDGDANGIFARRFAATGNPLATEFLVNSYTTSAQQIPTAAIGANSDFVIAWSSYTQDGSLNGIFARRYDSSGAAIGPEFQANVTTQSGQVAPSVAIDGNGDLVVAWTSYGQDDLYGGVFARRFDASGLPVASEFQVNITTTLGQRTNGVRADGDGDFVVCWQSYKQDDPASYGVFARRFGSSGIAQTAELQVNTYTPGEQRFAAIGMRPSGDFVIAWQSFGQDGYTRGIFAQRFAVLPKVFDVDGNGGVDPLTDGLLFLRYFFGFRNGTLVSGAVSPSCTRCTASPIEAYLAGLTEVALAQRAGPEFQVNAYTPGDQRAAAAAASADGDFVVAWQSPNDGDTAGVFAKRFDRNGTPLASEVQVNQFVTGSQSYPEVAMNDAGDFVVVWQSSGQDGNLQGIFARGFNSVGSPKNVEFQVNAFTTAAQRFPAIAMDAAGDFVVVWTHYPDGVFGDVFARRFNAALVPQGVEFQVNVRTAYSQAAPTVAMAPAGAFVVTWQDYREDYTFGIVARRFNASGVPQAAAFQVESYTTGSQLTPAVAADASGAFVIAWRSNRDGSGGGIFARRFDAAGVAQASELQVNSFTNGSQYSPAVRMVGSGEFVVSWVSPDQDGQGNGIFARRFSRAGVAQASELQINRFSAGDQSYPTIGIDPGGDFVVAWQSAAQDGSVLGVFAQRFDASRPADIDGDGLIQPLTDGLLVLRYVFGFRGATLIAGAVGPSCTRCAATAIEAYIASRV